MATHSPYANPSPRLKALAFAFAVLAVTWSAEMITSADSLRAMLVG